MNNRTLKATQVILDTLGIPGHDIVWDRFQPEVFMELETGAFVRPFVAIFDFEEFARSRHVWKPVAVEQAFQD